MLQTIISNVLFVAFAIVGITIAWGHSTIENEYRKRTHSSWFILNPFQPFRWACSTDSIDDNVIRTVKMLKVAHRIFIFLIFLIPLYLVLIEKIS